MKPLPRSQRTATFKVGTPINQMKFFHTFVLCMVGPVLVSDSDVILGIGSPNAANNEYFLRLGGLPFVSVKLDDLGATLEVVAVVPLPEEMLLAVSPSDDFARSSTGRDPGNAALVPIVVSSGFGGGVGGS